MLKKASMVAVGATAGLLALAPVASAGEVHDGGHHGHHSEVDDHSKNKNASSCDFTGGTGKADGGISGDAGLAGNVLTQIPVGGAVTSVGDCSNIVQDNLNGNTLLSDIDIL
jgi:hypothetical protein